MDLDLFADLLARQEHVIARRQLVAGRARPHEIQRWLRRDLVVLEPGVYVAHTGPLTWRQRVWAAVLAAEPAVVWGGSALRWHEQRDGPVDEVVHLGVARHRHRGAPEGVRLHRRVRLDERAHWQREPPIQRYEDAAIEVALASAARADRLEVLARAVRDRRTTAQRLLEIAATRPPSPDRDWIMRVLRDLAAGACSVLEQGYAELVERAHGLPTARRQAAGRSSAGLVYRDVAYDDGLLVELDGRLVHDSAKQRDADFERDLDAALAGRGTRRLTYGQVFDRPCSTAGKIGRLLATRGWAGRPTGCGPDCSAPALFTRLAHD